LLTQALRYADFYNWSDAAPLFAQAEQIFSARGDSRNALYAKFGRIRSTMDQVSLPEASQELGELEHNPLLQSDRQIRLFSLVVRGDIDSELDAASMKRDWDAALKLAQELGDKKWANRASGEIGFALFLEGDVSGARQKVGTALFGAMMLGDTGAQIRYLGAIGHLYVLMHSYDDALGYFDRALAIAAKNPDAGYQFLVQEGRLQAFRGQGRLDRAQQLADEIIAEARAHQKYVKEAQALIISSTLAVARHDDARAVQELQAAIELAQKGGFQQLLPDAEVDLADIYREEGDLARAESLAAAAVESTRAEGDTYLLPRRLQSLAELQVSQGKYREADATFDHATDILDTMIGNVRTAADKIGLITSMSAIYSEHFALVADHLNDVSRAYSVVERARGRATGDLLMSGSPPDSPEEERIQAQIAQLKLELSKAKSREQVRDIRDKILLEESGGWSASNSSRWKSRPWETVPLDRIRKRLSPDELLLEYVMGEPHAYCLVVTDDVTRIVSLPSRGDVEKLVAGYLETLKDRRTSSAQGRELYAALFNGIPEAAKKQRLIIVPDGRLHLLPFDALVDSTGRYFVYSHTITYAPSASSYYLLSTEAPHQTTDLGMLGVGGVPYDRDRDLSKLVTVRGYANSDLTDLPGSQQEVTTAAATIHSEGKSRLLLGQSATKSAFEHADLDHYSIIHLAVHGIADERHPERAALILLSDSKAGEDGILEATEVARLHTNAALVVLSACDTAVGRLQGEEGIATLSRAFLLAGAKDVVSTLWNIDDTSTLYLMKQFYAHLATGIPIADALTAAKRDMLKDYGPQAVPYFWASFKSEGVGDRPIAINPKK
jgi:CHAT domain-containing protein